MHELEQKPRRAVVVAVQLSSTTDTEFESSLSELRALAKTLGIEIVGQVTQKRGSFDPGAYLGSGKRDELRALIGAPKPEKATYRKAQKKDARLAGPEDDEDDGDDEDAADAPEGDDDGEGEPSDEPNDERTADDAATGKKVRAADTILVDHEISPSQARNLEKETGCDVLDRTMVILEIFHRHARSRAARAQVEMVRLKYLTPRLRETGKKADRQRGGIGGKGAGESELELDRRKIRDRIAELEEELARLEAERRTQRSRRRDRAGLARVALVGYTNAGKSTLMRALTGSEVYVADKLFATLDTTVRTLVPESVPRILVSDTVGFIKSLPHELVASFKSTLDEALEASLLAHVVDASDPDFRRQLAVTDAVLDEIGAGDVPRLVVWNKIDRVGDEAAQAARAAELLSEFPNSIVISARRATGEGSVASLRETFIAHFSRELEEGELRIAWDRQAMKGEVYALCQVLEERYDESGAWLRARAHPDVLARLKQALEGRASE